MSGIEKAISDWTALEFYNAGTEALTSGQIGRSVAYLERAHRSFPQDHDILNNLQIARSRLLSQWGQSDSSSLDPGRDILDMAADPTYAPWVSGGLALGVLAATFLAWRIVRKNAFRALWAPLLMASFLGGATLYLQHRASQATFALLQDVTVKSGPGDHYSPIATLKAGQIVREEGSIEGPARNQWKPIRYETDAIGWIPDSAILLLSPDSHKPKP